MDYDLARVFYLHLILHSEIGSVPIYSEMSIESSELLQLINMFQMSLNPANFLLCQVGLAAYPWVPSSKTRTLWGYQHNLVELNQKKVNKKKEKRNCHLSICSHAVRKNTCSDVLAVLPPAGRSDGRDRLSLPAAWSRTPRQRHPHLQAFITSVSFDLTQTFITLTIYSTKFITIGHITIVIHKDHVSWLTFFKNMPGHEFH